jgi:hypothetical protein
MFRALLSHFQKALHGCSETATVPQPTDPNARNIPNAVLQRLLKMNK